MRQFVSERKWERYHDPKNIAESICIEAGELLELFQWQTVEEAKASISDPEKRLAIASELADVMLYCLSMANVADLDIAQAIASKVEQNRARYPARA